MAHDDNHQHSHDPKESGPDESQQTKSFTDKKGTKETTLSIEGMDCPDEINVLERVLKPIVGVHRFSANLLKAQITVAHDEKVSPESLISAIKPTGMKARISDGKATEKKSHRSQTILVAASGALTGAGLLLDWLLGLGWPIQAAIFGAAILAGGWYIFPKALAAARRLAPDMNLLMVIAVTGAAIIGEWAEGAAVTFLFGLSELLEAFSVQRARRAIESLMALAPETALVKRSGKFAEVKADSVEVGETVAVKSGQRIPLDGTISEGRSAVNQAPITGESLPVEKTIGDTVFAGTVNGEGSLEVQVTKASGDSMLSRIVRLVSEAQSQKAPSQRFVDVFARYYTPAVIVLAILVCLVPPALGYGAWGAWFYRALVLLVIACPCALVIATPVSIVSGLTAMARAGVLIKGGAHLENIGKLKALAVDKTGTITVGEPKVLEVINFAGRSEENIMEVAAAIDEHSDHPLARAVVEYANANNIRFERGSNYVARTGRGAEATVEGRPCFIGNHRFAHELGVCTPELEASLKLIQERGLSIAVVGAMPQGADSGEVFGVLAIGDSIRPNAAAALKDLHAAGIKEVVMLSGDNQRTANAIARQAGIDVAEGELLPDQKIERVRALVKKHGYVGMIGDGVNDAPAMAAATTGIAMGKAGTDTAIEAADITLMNDDLSKVAVAVRLGRRALRMIQFNIAFALGVKAIFLLLSLFGHTSLWLAILADTGATLLVIMNALRLLRG